MGGERESTVDVKAKKKNGSGQETVIGKIRFHESKGEVHFHDDARQLKAAIPVAVWSQQWDLLKTGRKKKFEYFDPVNQTRFKITMAYDKRTRTLEPSLNLRKFSAGSTLQALETFTNGK